AEPPRRNRVRRGDSCRPASGLARAGRDHARFVNVERAHSQPTSVSPTHQAIAVIAVVADGVPFNSPRMVSMIGVNGWYSANCFAPGPILSAGTNALLRNGRRTSGTTAKAAFSAVFAARPNATVSQPIATTVSTIMPAT